MPRITVPEGQDATMFLWGSMTPDLTRPAGAFTGAVYASSRLGLREFEAARITIAGINDCQLCLNWRSARDVARFDGQPDVPESFYDDVLHGRLDALPDRERLAATFARLFAVDHLAIDDAMWTELHANFTDDELVDLALCVGSWVAFGRLNRVFDVDGACRVPG